MKDRFAGPVTMIPRIHLAGCFRGIMVYPNPGALVAAPAGVVKGRFYRRSIAIPSFK